MDKKCIEYFEAALEVMKKIGLKNPEFEINAQLKLIKFRDVSEKE